MLESMVDLANANHQSPTVSFLHQGMGERNVVQSGKFKKKFTKIFSFSCIHWMKDKLALFQNVADLLEENGEAFLIFMVYRNPLVDSVFTMAESKEWGQYYSMDVNILNGIIIYGYLKYQLL